MKRSGDVVGTWRLIVFLNEDTKRHRKYWQAQCVNCEIVKRIEESNMTPPAGGRCQNCWGRPKGTAGLKELIGTYKRNSTAYNREFSLSENDFESMTSQRCHYCHDLPSTISKGGSRSGWGDYVYNGIDRIDNSLGYTATNCVPCCTICNRAKNNMTYKDFITYIERIKNLK